MVQNQTTDKRTLQEMQEDILESSPDYIDDDLIVIDNVKLLAAPDIAYTNMNVLAYCSKGKSSISVDGETINIHSNQIFVCPPEVSLDNILISPDFEYKALGISNRMLQAVLRDRISLWNQFTYIKKLRVIEMKESDIVFYEKTCDLLKLCLGYRCEDADDAKYRAEVLRGIISAVLIGFCNTLRKHTDVEPESLKQNVSLFSRFMELLQMTEARHNTVDYYASKMCISAKYLTMICKKNSGKTANAWIQEYTISAITNYLRTTDLSVKEISNRLGFPNSSFFGKYVRDHLGCSPLEYRQKQSR